jgi:hypothetical protein
MRSLHVYPVSKLRFYLNSAFALLNYPPVNQHGLAGSHMLTEPHLQMTGQGRRPGRSDGFGHGLVQYGRYDSPMNDALKAFPRL